MFLFILPACNGNNTKSQNEDDAANTVTESLSTNTVNEKLRGKADSALIFCKTKGMNTDFCLLVDMSEHSGKKRFFVWDFKTDTIASSGLCAHGYGKRSTPSRPAFSNVEGSYCTSLGKYKTGARSYSQYGINVHYKLHGLEKTNDNAFRRIVVLHSFSEIPDHEIAPSHLPLGYSQGCPVINNSLMTELDMLLKKQQKPTLLWIYN
ncbi:peptidase [Dysgonomonas sp. 216]|nr:peptidase [Dysgonomonas sp. 216]